MVKAKTESQGPQTSISEKTPALLPPRDASTYRSQTSQVLEAAKALTIKSNEDMSKGADVLHTLKGIEVSLTTRKEEITRPLMASLASARDLFKPFEVAVIEAKKIIKQKMLDFQVAEDERIEKEKTRIATAVDKGKMKGTTAIAKLENLGDVQTSASGSTGSVQTRSITKVRVVDEAALPREYLVPDLAKITAAVLQQGINVPGTEKFVEKVMVSR